MVAWAEVDEAEEDEDAFVEDSDEIEAAEADANVSFQVCGW